MATTTTFDINKINKEQLANPATWGQVQGISYRFGKTKYLQKGKTDYRIQSQIRGCLWGLVKKGKLSFLEKCHIMSLNIPEVPNPLQIFYYIGADLQPLEIIPPWSPPKTIPFR